MGKMIFTTEKCKNPKKKPGWEKAAAEEAAWLAKINSTKLFSQPGKKYAGAKVIPGKKVAVVVNTAAPTLVGRGYQGKSVVTPGGSTGKLYIAPEVQYKGDEEMAKREAEARQRKFNAAPAYNKGGDQFVTEEELVKQLSSNKRR